MIPDNLKAVVETVKKLRDPISGCPWDLKQTHKSLTPYLIEEAYEFIDSVEQESVESMKDELGDVLLQVLLHARVAEQSNKFTLDDIAKNLNEKLIRRHPHVFNKTESLTPEEVTLQWQEIKKKEKSQQKETLLKRKLLFYPALQSAMKIGQRTSEINFDWDNSKQVMKKVEEEFKEFLAAREPDHIKEEFGDLLFTLAQLGRHLDINPEEALKEANQKFIRRFQAIEDLAESDNKDFLNLEREEKESYWKKVKKNEKAL